MSDRYSEMAQRLRVDVAAAVRSAQRRYIMRLVARYSAVVVSTAGLVTAGVLARKYVQSLAGLWRLLMILLLWLTIAIAVYQIARLAPGLERWWVGQSVWRSVFHFATEPAPPWVIVVAVATVLIAAGVLAYNNLPTATEWRASSDPLVTLFVGAGALLAAALARGAFRRWGASREQRSARRPVELPDDVRAEPHTRPVEVSAEPVPDGTRTFAVRLQPHADPGIQTLQEMTR